MRVVGSHDVLINKTAACSIHQAFYDQYLGALGFKVQGVEFGGDRRMGGFLKVCRQRLEKDIC